MYTSFNNANILLQASRHTRLLPKLQRQHIEKREEAKKEKEKRARAPDAQNPPHGRAKGEAGKDQKPLYNMYQEQNLHIHIPHEHNAMHTLAVPEHTLSINVSRKLLTMDDWQIKDYWRFSSSARSSEVFCRIVSAGVNTICRII